MIIGNDLYCYRKKGDKNHRVMHSIIGTFLEEKPKELWKKHDMHLYPVKLVIPPSKSRILYFKQQTEQEYCFNQLKDIVGYQNL